MYKVFKQVIPQETLVYLQDWTLFTKEICEFYRGKPKANGSGVYWQGLDMASQCPLTTEQQNKKLFEVYTSQWMYDLVSQHIPKPYLFNDQIVVKLPGEQFNFSPHRDNQFGPLPDDANLVTQNFTLVLDDFTQENGALQVWENKQWHTLLPKAGDIIMIEGNTIHKSAANNSDKPRRVYICHYTDRPIGESFQKGFYNQPFSR
jgi:hypothetical protein